jgi:isochorismate synthase
VEAIKKEIQSGSIDKAVLSRVHLVEREMRPEPAEIFKVLCVKYPKAFKYILNIPGAGNWIGATPEPLIEACGDVAEAVSLAGTRKLNGAPAGKVEWQTKEREEQKFVTVYIENLLADFGITPYRKNGPFNEQAADLVHLKSSFTFDRNLLKEKFGEFVSALHPTPSVCGLPKETASGFIRQLEKHERRYYTGFLGPLNLDGNAHLFVNLRCMQVLPHRFALFAGAGITASSDPGSEWDETEFKMQTLLSVLNHPDPDHE